MTDKFCTTIKQGLLGRGSTSVKSLKTCLLCLLCEKADPKVKRFTVCSVAKIYYKDQSFSRTTLETKVEKVRQEVFEREGPCDYGLKLLTNI